MSSEDELKRALRTFVDGSGLIKVPPGSVGMPPLLARTKLLVVSPARRAEQRDRKSALVFRNPDGNGASLPLRSEIAELIVMVPDTPNAEEAL